MITFAIPGTPVPKARARVVRGRAFTPRATAAFERKVALCAKVALQGRGPVVGPVEVVCAFYLPDARRRDGDNLFKSVTDALNGLAYADDSQICSGHWTKHIDRENPRCVVTVEPLT